MRSEVVTADMMVVKWRKKMMTGISGEVIFYEGVLCEDGGV